MFVQDSAPLPIPVTLARDRLLAYLHDDARLQPDTWHASAQGATLLRCPGVTGVGTRGDRTHRPGPPARCQHRHPDLVDLDRRPRTSAGRHPRTRPPPGRHQPADLVRTVPATVDPTYRPSRASRHRPRRPGRSPQLPGSLHPRHRRTHRTHRAQLPRRQHRQALTDEPRHRERNQPSSRIAARHLLLPAGTNTPGG